MNMQSSSPSRPSILVVDDSRMNRKILSVIVKKLGFAVHEAEQGVQACEIFVRETGIVAVFLDLNMPMLNGWQTVAKLRKMEKTAHKDPSVPANRLPVIVFTANDLQDRHGPEDATVCSSAISAGADEVLHKPACMRLDAVELVLDRLLPLWREAVSTA